MANLPTIEELLAMSPHTFVEVVTGMTYDHVPMEHVVTVENVIDSVTDEPEAMRAWAWLCARSAEHMVDGEDRNVFAGDIKAEARRYGAVLNAVGGFPLMRSVFYAFAWWLQKPGQPARMWYDSSLLEYAWVGIGEWRC